LLELFLKSRPKMKKNKPLTFPVQGELGGWLLQRGKHLRNLSLKDAKSAVCLPRKTSYLGLRLTKLSLVKICLHCHWHLRFFSLKSKMCLWSVLTDQCFYSQMFRKPESLDYSVACEKLWTLKHAPSLWFTVGSIVSIYYDQ
jgi:hypothetical protein